MNKGRFTEFASYLESFTQRMVVQFPDTKDFVNEEKVQMLAKFPELAASQQSSQARSQYDVVKYTLDSSINNKRRMCYHEVEIKRDTPEQCVDTLNILANAIGNAHRDILYYSSMQGDLLSSLKDTCGASFSVILRNNINISRAHANFLMKFYKLVLEYPRLLKCELPQNFFYKNFKNIQLICENDKQVWSCY